MENCRKLTGYYYYYIYLFSYFPALDELDQLACGFFCNIWFLRQVLLEFFKDFLWFWCVNIIKWIFKNSIILERRALYDTHLQNRDWNSPGGHSPVLYSISRVPILYFPLRISLSRHILKWRNLRQSFDFPESFFNFLWVFPMGVKHMAFTLLFHLK